MDQIKIGKFIAECRKNKNLTQMQLANKLNITDRAISKWETGKSMPDSLIMLDLCNELGISVNELLSGERIEMNNYDKKAEENLFELNKNNEDKNKKISKFGTVITFLIGIIIILLVYMFVSNLYGRYKDMNVLRGEMLFNIVEQGDIIDDMNVNISELEERIDELEKKISE